MARLHPMEEFFPNQRSSYLTDSASRSRLVPQRQETLTRTIGMSLEFEKFRWFLSSFISNSTMSSYKEGSINCDGTGLFGPKRRAEVASRVSALADQSQRANRSEHFAKVALKIRTYTFKTIKLPANALNCDNQLSCALFLKIHVAKAFPTFLLPSLPEIQAH